jgi:hypothetical protein
MSKKTYQEELEDQIAEKDELISQLTTDLSIAKDQIRYFLGEQKILEEYDNLGYTISQLKNALHFCETRGFDPKVHTL